MVGTIFLTFQLKTFQMTISIFVFSLMLMFSRLSIHTFRSISMRGGFFWMHFVECTRAGWRIFGASRQMQGLAAKLLKLWRWLRILLHLYILHLLPGALCTYFYIYTFYIYYQELFKALHTFTFIHFTFITRSSLKLYILLHLYILHLLPGALYVQYHARWILFSIWRKKARCIGI